MQIGFESLLVAIAFVLPGFLTSRLVEARTPAAGRERSVFEETAESLLRSSYIHLVIALALLTALQVFVLPGRPDLLTQIPDSASQFEMAAVTVPASWFVLGWLLLSYLLAFVFGYWWDPLDVGLNRLVAKTGLLTEDPFYLLREAVAERRAAGEFGVGIWLQARMENGSVYQGEFMFGSYRHPEKSRELLLANARYYQPRTGRVPEEFDFVFIDTENCLSLDFRLVE